MNIINLSTSSEAITSQPLAAMPEKAFGLSIIATNEGEYIQTDSDRCTFETNLDYWNNEIRFSSSNNFDNSYFDEITNMGTKAVPFILEELKKGPTQLVYALQCIFPGKVKCKGNVSLERICEVWLKLLTK